MAGQRLKGNESWQELRARAEGRYNELRDRRGEGSGISDYGVSGLAHSDPIDLADLMLIGEANFLVSLAEMERARG